MWKFFEDRDYYNDHSGNEYCETEVGVKFNNYKMCLNFDTNSEFLGISFYKFKFKNNLKTKFEETYINGTYIDKKLDIKDKYSVLELNSIIQFMNKIDNLTDKNIINVNYDNDHDFLRIYFEVSEENKNKITLGEDCIFDNGLIIENIFDNGDIGSIEIDNFIKHKNYIKKLLFFIDWKKINEL